MSFLYVVESGTQIKLEEGRVSAQRPDGSKTYIPVETLEGVILFGRMNMTAACSVELLKRGIPVTYLSKTGNFYGRLESTKHVNIKRQREQFRKGDDVQFCTRFGISEIAAKINNQSVLLRRYLRNYSSQNGQENLAKMNIIEKSALKAQSIEQLLGYEGSAARLYFEALSSIVRKEFKFNGRNKMPPRDPFNSLLSLGYTLLMYEMYSAIVNRGLNPYAGFMHKDKQKHPTLASDMLEEWRPIIVDSLVMNMVQNSMLKPEDFYTADNGPGVYLKKDAMDKFIKGFEQKIRVEAGYLPYVDYPMSFRRAIQFQTGALAKAIEEDDLSIYHAVRIR